MIRRFTMLATPPAARAGGSRCAVRVRGGARPPVTGTLGSSSQDSQDPPRSANAQTPRSPSRPGRARTTTWSHSWMADAMSEPTWRRSTPSGASRRYSRLSMGFSAPWPIRRHTRRRCSRVTVAKSRAVMGVAGLWFSSFEMAAWSSRTRWGANCPLRDVNRGETSEALSCSPVSGILTVKYPTVIPGGRRWRAVFTSLADISLIRFSSSDASMLSRAFL